MVVLIARCVVDVCVRAYRSRRRRRAGVSLSMKTRPILLDMTAPCGTGAANELPSPTHRGLGATGAMTTLDYGVCELIPATTDPTGDWRRHTPVTVHRGATYDEARCTPAAALAGVDCYAEHHPASVGRNWSSADDDVELDSGRVCCATYHHHHHHHHLNTTSTADGTAADLSTSSDAWTPAAVCSQSTSTSSSYRPSAVRTTANAGARTHVYDMPLFHA